jgi:hypothetical protein
LANDVTADLLDLALSGHPRVLADLLDGKTLVAVVGEHLDNEVLEL